MRKGRIIAICVAAALALLAWFAADIPFYTFEEPLSRASLTSVMDGEALSFTYENDAITLHGAENATVYGLTLSGVAEIPNGQADGFPSDSLGALAAVKPAYQADTDGDDVAEAVIDAAKTDMEYTQEYHATTSAFLDSRLPFEATLSERHVFTFTLNGSSLANAQIDATLADGRTVSLTTDASGASDALSINDIRGGVQFTYRPDNATTYRLNYCVEDNTVFSLRWLSAMMPFTLIILIALVCIILDVTLRKRLYQKNGLPESRVKITHKGEGFRLPRFGFEMIRWMVMLLSFVLLIWGGKLLGSALFNVELPILACPYNLDQLTSAGCYWFSHIDVLLGLPIGEILWFIGSFVVCAVLFGRMLCGFVCPLGFIQDVMHQLRQALHVEGVPLNERIYAMLRLIKWCLLILFLGIGLIGGSFCDFCPAITLSPALAGFKTSIYFSGFVMVAVLVSGFFKRRCFCNICPMGYLLGLPHKVSLARLKKDAVACTECGACYEACPMGIKSIFTIREGKNERAIDVTTADCIFCGECIRRCPEDGALYMTLAGKRIYTALRMQFMRDYMNRGKERLK